MYSSSCEEVGLKGYRTDCCSRASKREMLKSESGIRDEKLEMDKSIQSLEMLEAKTIKLDNNWDIKLGRGGNEDCFSESWLQLVI